MIIYFGPSLSHDLKILLCNEKLVLKADFIGFLYKNTIRPRFGMVNSTPAYLKPIMPPNTLTLNKTSLNSINQIET